MLVDSLSTELSAKLLKPNHKKTNNPAKTCAKGLNRRFSRKDIQMINKHMRKYSISLIIRKMKIKTTIRYYLASISMDTTKETETNKY